MGASGWQVVAGLVAIAGLFFTIGGFIWGHGKGVGKNSQRWEQTTQVLQEVRNEFEGLQSSLNNCQKVSASNKASHNEKFAAGSAEQDKLRQALNDVHKALHAHEASQEVHTNSEWRQATISRMEIIYSNMDKRLQSFETNVGGRLGSLESTMHAFFNSGKGKPKNEA
jgi:preprotein translocase subunit SecF